MCDTNRQKDKLLYRFWLLIFAGLLFIITIHHVGHLQSPEIPGKETSHSRYLKFYTQEDADFTDNSIRINQYREEHIRTKKKIIIMTTYRSGSSFVGSILAHMPDSFYIFEPLMFLKFNEYGNSTTQALLSQKLSYYLSNIVDCNLTIIKNDSKKYFHGHYYDKQRKLWLPRAFAGPEDRAVSFLPMKHNGYNSFEAAMSQCKKKSTVITKVIRANHLTDMIQVLKDNITLLHLVRDPRGLFSSRLKMKTDDVQSYLNNATNLENERIEITKQCNLIMENFNFAKSNINNDKTLQYLVLRYEDFAIDSVKMAKKLYNVFNVYDQGLEEWINKATGSGSKQTDHRDIRYATKKDSANVAMAWRTYLPYYYIEMVQKQCEQVMMAYGYKPVVDNQTTTFLSEIPDYFPHL